MKIQRPAPPNLMLSRHEAIPSVTACMQTCTDRIRPGSHQEVQGGDWGVTTECMELSEVRMSEVIQQGWLWRLWDLISFNSEGTWIISQNCSYRWIQIDKTTGRIHNIKHPRICSAPSSACLWSLCTLARRLIWSSESVLLVLPGVRVGSEPSASTLGQTFKSCIPWRNMLWEREFRVEVK